MRAFLVALTILGASCSTKSNATVDAPPGTTDGSSSIDAAFVHKAQTYLKASNTDQGDLFGTAISISADGNTLAVGAPNEASAAVGVNGDQTSNAGSGGGAVYVFARAGGNWAQQAYVKASNTPEAALAFGTAVALSANGDTLVVGAPKEGSIATGIDGNQTNVAAQQSGAVYVFTRSGTAWTQQAYVKASNTGAGDLFGFAVAVSADGSTLAAGAYNESSSAVGIDGDGTNDLAASSGAVYVFSRAGTVWAQQAYVKASNTDGSDEFGVAVALSGDGNTLAVGALGESSNAVAIGGSQVDNSASFSGAAYVFTRAGTAWTQQAYVKASNTDANDTFGYSIALSGNGNTLAVGAKSEASAGTDQHDNSTSGAGAVYVYTRASASWSQQAYVKSSNIASGDNFGSFVALSTDGSTLVATSAGAADVRGVAYVYLRTGTTWGNETIVTASNADSADLLGACAISGDGSTLALGAYGEASRATGVGGDQTDNSKPASGAAYIVE